MTNVGLLVKGISRQAFRPWALATVAAVGASAALLLADRGREPVALSYGRSAPLDSFAGSATVGLGLLMTWVGLIVVGLTVAWSVGYDLEHRLDDTYRATGVRLSDRLLGSLGFAFVSAAVTTVVHILLVFAAGHFLEAVGERSGSTLRMAVDDVAAWIVAITFWWVFACALSVVLRSAAVVSAALVGTALTGLILGNIEQLRAFLPTTWLGAMAGFERDGATLTDIWTTTSALGFSWEGSGRYSSILATIAVSLAVLVLLGLWASKQHRRVRFI